MIPGFFGKKRDSNRRYWEQLVPAHLPNSESLARWYAEDPLRAMFRVGPETSATLMNHGIKLFVIGRDEEGFYWFQKAKEIIDLGLAAGLPDVEGIGRYREMHLDPRYKRHWLLRYKCLCDWVLDGHKDLNPIQESIKLLEVLYDVYSCPVSDPDYREQYEELILDCAEAEDYGRVKHYHDQVLGPMGPESTAQGLESLGRLVYAVTLLENESPSSELYLAVRDAYRGFMKKNLKYDRNGPIYPFLFLTRFVQLVYLGYRYVDRVDVPAVQVIKAIRGY